jgi:hypothetical protein
MNRKLIIIGLALLMTGGIALGAKDFPRYISPAIENPFKSTAKRLSLNCWREGIHRKYWQYPQYKKEAQPVDKGNAGVFPAADYRIIVRRGKTTYSCTKKNWGLINSCRTSAKGQTKVKKRIIVGSKESKKPNFWYCF